MRMLFFAHSGLRHLVLLAGVLAIAYFAYLLATKSGNERVARILGASFVGLLDLQIVIGIVMVALGLFYPALIGHLFMMIGAAVVAHVALAMGKNTDPPSRGHAIRLAGVAIALLLVVGGILAIGRSVFGTSGGPTVF
jgi:heme A synthase